MGPLLAAVTLRPVPWEESTQTCERTAPEVVTHGPGDSRDREGDTSGDINETGSL